MQAPSSLILLRPCPSSFRFSFIRLPLFLCLASFPYVHFSSSWGLGRLFEFMAHKGRLPRRFTVQRVVTGIPVNNVFTVYTLYTALHYVCSDNIPFLHSPLLPLFRFLLRVLSLYLLLLLDLTLFDETLKLFFLLVPWPSFLAFFRIVLVSFFHEAFGLFREKRRCTVEQGGKKRKKKKKKTM